MVPCNLAGDWDASSPFTPPCWYRTLGSLAWGRRVRRNDAFTDNLVRPDL